MKKSSKKMFAKAFLFTGCLVIVLAIACLTSACGNSEYVGDWEVVKLEVGGETYDVKAVQEYAGSSLNFDFSMTLEANGKGTFNSNGTMIDVKWEAEDNGVKLSSTETDGNMTMEKDGSYLRQVIAGSTIYYEKQ